MCGYLRKFPEAAIRFRTQWPANEVIFGESPRYDWSHTIYGDAKEEDVRSWYVSRFLRLRETAFADPGSYFHRYAGLSDTESARTAEGIWTAINGVNLVENVLPTRGRASLVLAKGADHSVTRIRLRKL